MIMTISCNPQINSCYLLRSLNLVIFGLNSTKACRHWVSCECNSSYNFYLNLFETLHVFLSNFEDVHEASFKPQIYFCYFFRSLTLVVFVPTSNKHIDTG